MAKWEVDSNYDPASRPGYATVVPALPQPPASPGAGTDALHPLTIILRAAGAINDGFSALAPAPQPTMSDRAQAFTSSLPPAMQPPLPGPSADVERPVVAPPVNSDLFGRFIRGVFDVLPSAQSPAGKDRTASIFRLAADRAFRDNTALGAAVSNIEAGKGINQAPRPITYTDHTGRVRTEQAGGDIYGMGYTPEEYAANAAEAERRDIAYRQNAAQKRDQLRALGPLSTDEQIGSVIASLFGSLLSPETAVGPGAAAYAKAGTAGKAALGAGANAAVVGVTDPIAQGAAVQRGDRQAYSPAEHALATGGAAALGAIIPALGALARRFGALRDVPAPSTRPADVSPEQPKIDTPPVREEPRAPVENPPVLEGVILPSEKVGQPKPQEAPAVEVRREGYEIVRNPEAPRPAAAEAQRLVRQSLERMDERMGVPAEAPRVPEVPPKAASESAIAEAPRAPVEPAKPVEPEVIRTPQSADKQDVPAVSRPQVDKVDGPRESAGMQQAEVATPPVRAAAQPPDIPDFMRRPLPGKEAPAPAPEPPRADPAPPKPAEGAVGKEKPRPRDVKLRGRFTKERIAEVVEKNNLQIGDRVLGEKTHVVVTGNRPRRQYDDARKETVEVPGREIDLSEHGSGRTFTAYTKGDAPPKAAEGPVGARDADEAFLKRVMETPAIERTRADIDRANQITRSRDAKIAADEKAKVDAKEARLNDFLAGKTPMAAGLSSKVLKKQRMYQGKGDIAHQYIEREVDAGRTITRGKDGRRRLTDERGAFYEEGTARGITKQEMDYAEHLIAKRDAQKPAQPTDAAPKSPAQSIENRDFTSAKLDAKPDSVKNDEPAHPLASPPDKPTEMHGSFGLTPAVAKAAGPEIVGALVGGTYDHWETYGRFGLTTRGALMGALAVAALRHRIPGLAKPIVGKTSFAKDALKATGDAYAKLAAKGPAWLNFHPTMGVEKDLWDKLVRVKVETRNFQDDALKIAKHIRENTTADERILISDWIERRDLKEHGVNSWTAADDKIKGMADALVAHVDGVGERLTKVGMLDKDAFARLKGEYLHRYYLPKLAADDGFKAKAARMKASATFALRRGETVEGVDAGAFKAGDRAVQWTHGTTGEVQYRPPGETPGPEFFSNKEFAVERVADGKMALHRDYTPQERTRMGEIRDANFRFAMGSMEASRDLALGTMFKDLAENPRWSSAADPGGWKKVPTDAVGAGSAVKKYGLLAGRWVSPETWDALKITRKPWSPDELEKMGGVMNGYLKAMGMWKVGKTAYNPATHFNNVMGNVSLSALTGEVGPVHLMKAVGAFKRKDAIIEEAKRAGLSLGREANLGDTFDGVRVDIGLATGMDPRSGWTRFMDWYTNNAIVRAYQHEDALFKLGAYMRRREAGESPESAVAGAHKVFFDYSDVPLGVQAVRDFYSPFFTYTYKYAQVMIREMAERPHRYLAAFGILSALDMMSYDWMYGDRAKAVSDFEREMAPKWLQGRSGFGAQKAIRLPWNKPDEQTGESRALMLNTRYLIPGGDILDWVANGDFGPSIYPQALGNTILGGNPLVNLMQSLATGKDTFFGKPIMPYPDTNLWDFGKRPAGEITANWGAAIRFMATQALPPTLFAAPDKIGQGLTAEGVVPKGSQAAEFFGWTGQDFAGRQRSLARAVASVLGVKIEDVAPDKAMRFREAELGKEVRENLRNARSLHRNQGTTDTRKENAVESFKDRIERFKQETQRMRDLREKAGDR